MARKKIFNVRLDPSEAQMIRSIAAYTGLSQSDTVRQLVRARHADIFGPRQPHRAIEAKGEG